MYFVDLSIFPFNFHLFFCRKVGGASGRRNSIPRRWMTSRRPLVLTLGGNTILFRLLTKPLFCSFPLLDDRKAPNGGICTEREEVSEKHEELNKIKILFNLEEMEILDCLPQAVLERFSPGQALPH